MMKKDKYLLKVLDSYKYILYKTNKFFFHIETSIDNNTPRRAASQRGFAHWRATLYVYTLGDKKGAKSSGQK